MEHGKEHGKEKLSYRSQDDGEGLIEMMSQLEAVLAPYLPDGTNSERAKGHYIARLLVV